MNTRPYLYISLVILLFYGGTMAQDPLAGTNWTVTYARGANIGSVEAFLNFDASANRFTGNTGCNIVNGTLSVQKDHMLFSKITTTKRACTRQTAPVESAVLSALNTATHYQLSDSGLRLFAGGRLEMQLRSRSIHDDTDKVRNPADSVKLGLRKWVLESIAGNPIPKVEQEAFINFDRVKGSAGGDTSCNAFGGSYSVKGNKISITDVISTMRACVEDERMNIERSFLDALQDADRYEIKADKLLLFDHSKLLLTFDGRSK